MKVCRFFEWYDEECSERDKKIICGLFRKVEALKKEKMMKLELMCTWVLFSTVVGAVVGDLCS